mmetsp:Transcript_58566/g.137115  ORF Transcript_58566/g.137115 Transcript_58566/m.137115 type:complete len:587 (-) Transcript_58566:521-2281(-)
MCAKVQQRIRLENELQVGVESGKAMVRRGGLGKEQPHRVALISECRLHSQEDVAELLTINQQILAVSVELSRWSTPILAQVRRKRTQLLVFVHSHAVRNIQVGHGHRRFRILQDRLLQSFNTFRHVLHSVAFFFQLSHHRKDASKNVQVRRSSNVALVRWELEDANAELLLGVGLLAEVGPVHGTSCHGADTVLHGDGAATGSVTAGEDQGLNRPVDLWQRHLQRNLDGMKAKLTVLPFCERLEHQGHAHQIGPIEFHQDLLGLFGILRCRSSNQRETGQVDKGVHIAFSVRASQVLLHRHGEVQTASVSAGHARAAPFQLLHHAHIMSVILRGDVRFLQDQTDGWRIWHDASCGAVNVVVPFLVLPHAVKDGRCQRMPNSHVRQNDRLHNRLGVNVLHARNITPGNAKEHGLQVLWSAAEPVLEGENEGPGVLGLVARKELQDLRERPDQLQQTVLEVAPRCRLVLGEGLLPQVLHLLGEVSQWSAGDLCQVEGAKLVLLHHLGHRWKAEAGVEVFASGFDDLHKLLSELLHENQRTNENVRIIQILGQLLLAGGIADFLQQVSHTLHADRARRFVDLTDGCRHC